LSVVKIIRQIIIRKPDGEEVTLEIDHARALVTEWSEKVKSYLQAVEALQQALEELEPTKQKPVKSNTHTFERRAQSKLAHNPRPKTLQTVIECLNSHPNGLLLKEIMADTLLTEYTVYISLTMANAQGMIRKERVLRNGRWCIVYKLKALQRIIPDDQRTPSVELGTDVNLDALRSEEEKRRQAIRDR